MGSINRVWNPICWKIGIVGKSKVSEDDVIYKMIIGDGEDYQYYEIIEFISKNNYENIINGNYFIKTFPSAELPILLFNEKQELIPLVRGTEIPYDKLTRIQKEYISSLNSKKVFSRNYVRK